MRHTTGGHVLGLVMAGLVVVGLGACSQSRSDTTSSTPSIEDMMFALAPAKATVKASFLGGDFEGLQVYQRVEQGTGKVVEPPKLQGRFTLKNLSEEQAARPLAVHVSYIDEAGQPIRLAEGRDAPTFTFPYYQDRLDPGATTTATLDVPFPAAALKGVKLGEVRLELSYIPIPIREETMSVKVGLSAKK